MAFKQKEYQLKPNEVIPLDAMEVGVLYMAAAPLRELKWRVISDCCRVQISHNTEVGGLQSADDSILICSKCKNPCQKQWTTISRLIPSLARDDDQHFQKMDQF